MKLNLTNANISKVWIVPPKTERNIFRGSKNRCGVLPAAVSVMPFTVGIRLVLHPALVQSVNSV